MADAPATVAASTAHPLATQAALQMLAEGGSAADALVAAQAVLGLVEPQSSGFGGGALLLLWEPATKRLHSYDGLAAAPVQATAGLRNDLDGRLLPLDAVVRGGRSIGVPGAPALLHELHAKHGLLPWSRLFDPALKLARGGHPLAPYLARVLTQDAAALRNTGLATTHFDAAGQPLAAGTVLRHAAYAHPKSQSTSGKARRTNPAGPLDATLQCQLSTRNRQSSGRALTANPNLRS